MTFWDHLVANSTLAEADGDTWDHLTNPAGGDISGIIKIQNNVWQLVAIPRDNVNVKEYFVDRLADKYTLPADDIVDICSAYFGDENRFRSYIPGITNPNTSNNFPLKYSDDGNDEITGFWVKIKDLTGKVADINDVTFEWSSN